MICTLFTDREREKNEDARLQVETKQKVSRAKDRNDDREWWDGSKEGQTKTRSRRDHSLSKKRVERRQREKIHTTTSQIQPHATHYQFIDD